MRVLVTGSMGFIGKHLCRALLDESDELCFVSRNSLDVDLLGDRVTSLRGDLSDERIRAQIKDFAPETVFHLAWNGIPDYGLQTSIDNLILNINLLVFFGQIGIKRVIATGSCWEYGKVHGQLSESLIVDPNNAFTTAKDNVFKMGQFISTEYDFTFIWARLFYVYGPGQSGHSLLPSLINMGLAGENPIARSPLARNDFVFVRDVAHILKSMNDEVFESGSYNVGSGESTLVGDIANFISGQFGYEPVTILQEDERGEKAPNFWADLTKLRSRLQFELTSIKDGLEETIKADLS